MSGSHGAPDPSMEDILASIRRILSEEEPTPDEPPAHPQAMHEAMVHDDVLDLDASMIVEDPYAATPAIAAPHIPPAAPMPHSPVHAPMPDIPAPMAFTPPNPEPPPHRPPAMPSHPPILEVPPVSNMPAPDPHPTSPNGEDSLVGAQSAAGVASSVGELVRAMAAKREPVPVHRGGPTIEDLVREEIRPLLKSWLDSELPPLVERLVRTEIERVVGRVF